MYLNELEKQIELRGMEGKRCRKLVILIIMLSCAVIFVGLFLATAKTSPLDSWFRGYEASFTRQHYNSYKFPILIFGGLGGIVFLVAAFVGGLFAQTYKIIFKPMEIVVSSKGQYVSIPYHNLTECFIVNDTDYSRIVFTLTDGKKYTLYLGLCHMMHSDKQIILDSIHALDPFFTNFLMEKGGRRGENTITYYQNKQDLDVS